MLMRVDNSENSRGVCVGFSEASLLLRDQSQVVCGEVIKELPGSRFVQVTCVRIMTIRSWGRLPHPSVSFRECRKLCPCL